jgi:hypothetical protein
MELSTVTDERPAGTSGKRLQLILVVAAFLGPIVAAVLLYANADRWLAGGPSGQHGQLFDPVRPLEELALTRVDGTPMALSHLRGKWTMVYIGQGTCDQGCRDALYKIRQAHKAQGKNIGRVQRLFVALGGQPGQQATAYLEAEHPKLMVARPANGPASLKPFRHPKAEELRGIYVLDPNTNLVLRYRPDAGAKGVLKDLEHLLKHSTIG